MDRLALTRVDMLIDDNLWWTDAFQFGDPTDFTWDFIGTSFYLSIKKHDDDLMPVLALTSNAGQIVVEDTVNRILSMLVPDATIKASLSEGKYVYDLLMVTNATGQTDGLMYGEIHVAHGITMGPN